LRIAIFARETQRFPAMPPRNTVSYVVPAVESAISILETLGTAQPMSLTELSKELGLGKSSVYRLLVTLALRGYVEKAPSSDRYQLTYRLFAVGSHAAEQLGLREVAQPIMRRLASRTGETVNLGVLDGFRTVSIYLVESAHPLRIHMRIGGVAAHATSTGKILLAALPPEELARRLAGRRLTSLTGRTIKGHAALQAELRRVRDQGYAIDDEECSLGLRCVGAPIRDHRGTVLAALSMVAPCHRLPPSALPAAIAMVREAAQEISHRLGFAEEQSRGGGEATHAGHHDSHARRADAGTEAGNHQGRQRGGVADRQDTSRRRPRDFRGSAPG
jgi:DNA-binding IclR family transcriptional regulator